MPFVLAAAVLVFACRYWYIRGWREHEALIYRKAFHDSIYGMD